MSYATERRKAENARLRAEWDRMERFAMSLDSAAFDHFAANVSEELHRIERHERIRKGLGIAGKSLLRDLLWPVAGR